MEKFALLVADNIDGMMAYWDKDQVCKFANRSYKQWFYKKNDEMASDITMKELLGDAYEMNLPHITAALNGVPQHFESEVEIAATCDKRYTVASYIPNTVSGVVEGFFVHVTDISSIKKLELELKSSALKFKTILENAPNAIIILNGEKAIEIINKKAEQLFGYRKEELQGRYIDQLIPERYRDEFRMRQSALYAASFGSLVNNELELFGLTKNNTELPVAISFSIIKLGEGLHFSIAVRDISLQKQAEQELKKSTDRNKIFIEQAPNALAMFDTNMRYIAASEKWIKAYGLLGKELIGQSHYDIFPEIGEKWKLIHQACLQGEISQCNEAAFERADGSTQWLSWDIRPWYVSEENIGGLLMYTSDITHVKKADLEKRRIEEILDKSNEIARIGHWEVDLLSNNITWSRITKQIHEVPTGYEPEFDSAINFYKEGVSRQRIISAIAESSTSGNGFDVELEIVTAKNNNRWVRAIGQAELKNNVCKRIYGVFQDIDEMRKSKESLNKANEELRTILNAGHVSIIGTDKEGTITHFSKGAEILLQYDAAEMIGINTPVLIHLDEELIKRGEFLSSAVGKNISGVDVLIADAVQKKFDSKEWTYVRKDGSTFPVQLVISAIGNPDSEITGFLWVATDISATKKAEEDMKMLLDITTEQNKRLKNFAHIVSHNLLSHAGNIGMMVDLFIKKNPEAANDKIVAHLKNASNSLKETLTNLNEIVVINNSIDHNFISIGLHKAINSAINSVKELAAESDVEIFNTVNPSIDITCLPAYLDSILINFITNGIKYKSSGRKSTISLSASKKENFIVLKVEDNGLGINLTKNGDKLFGMYKTFHGNQDARGIGLFITKNQVEAMGGKIEVESEVNKGTIFNIYFKYEKY